MAANDDRLPPGMKPDGTLTVLEPGAPIPPVTILTPEGDKLTPDEAAAIADLEAEEDGDISDLDDPIPEG